jgi:hypothetical protein
MNGRRTEGEIADRTGISRDDLHSVVMELSAHGLASERGARWRAFYDASANPMISGLPQTSNVPWAAPVDVETVALQRPIIVESIGIATAMRRRRSFDRSSPPEPDPIRSENAALIAVHASYGRVDGIRRPVASAGGLEPVVPIIVGCAEPSGERRLLVLAEDGSGVIELGRLATEELVEAIVPDGVIEKVVADGAAVVVLTIDCGRVMHKYGERGFRYALMEAGAVSHALSLVVSELKCSARPVGGFFDRKVASWTRGLIPVLMVVIVADGSQGD